MGSRLRLGVPALVAGVAASVLVTGWPAAAADQTVMAQGSTAWNPDTVSIAVGETVTWQNPLASGGEHNVCVSKGTSQGVCDEYKSGDPQLPAQWPSAGYSHTFDSAGTYVFECTLHTNMTGTITVGSGSGATTTSTTATETTPTQTQTYTYPTPTQTQTQTTTAPADTTAPSFTDKLRRRASRRSVVLELGSSEDATLAAKVFRRVPHARSFTRVGRASLAVHAGRNTVRLPRSASGRLRSGSYKVVLTLTDAAGNRSPARILRFKLG